MTSKARCCSGATPYFTPTCRCSSLPARCGYAGPAPYSRGAPSRTGSHHVGIALLPYRIAVIQGPARQGPASPGARSPGARSPGARLAGGPPRSKGPRRPENVRRGPFAWGHARDPGPPGAAGPQCAGSGPYGPLLASSPRTPCSSRVTLENSTGPAGRRQGMKGSARARSAPLSCDARRALSIRCSRAVFSTRAGPVQALACLFLELRHVA